MDITQEDCQLSVLLRCVSFAVFVRRYGVLHESGFLHRRWRILPLLAHCELIPEVSLPRFAFQVGLLGHPYGRYASWRLKYALECS